jgi:predicted glycosyltransferase
LFSFLCKELRKGNFCGFVATKLTTFRRIYFTNSPKLEKFNTKVLIAPLDWGLGHTTRCLPIVAELLQQGCQVFLAAEGDSAVLLKESFPGLTILPLFGYGIRYSQKSWWLLPKLLGQVPGIWQKIKAEQHWLAQQMQVHQFDCVISDNRYGLHHADAHCVLMTHQLMIQSPARQWVQRLHYRLINQFDACWVPDWQGQPNLSGALGHPTKLPGIPLHYLGALSRLEKTDIQEKKYDLSIILSGPEPMRSQLEKQVLQQAANSGLKILLVLGKPRANANTSTANLEIVNHLSPTAMALAMQQSHFVLSRSGYTTVMDAAKLGCQCIFVPTPGQTEQVYLGRYMSAQKMALVVPQQALHLQQAVAKARQLNWQFGFAAADFEQYRLVIKALLESI